MSMSVRMSLSFSIGAAACLGLVPAKSAAVEQQIKAEYAIRWNPANGGPTGAREAADKLDLVGGDTEKISVRFDRMSADTAPTGYMATLRERRKPKKFELTYKLRGESPLTGDVASWNCPLGPTQDRKDEFDVTFTNVNVGERRFSRSCTIEEKKQAPPLPPTLRAVVADCESEVTRIEWNDGTTIEEWRMKGKGVMIEVSRKDTNSPAAREAFVKSTVERLIHEHRIAPVTGGMSDWGAACPSASEATGDKEAIR